MDEHNLIMYEFMWFLLVVLMALLWVGVNKGF